MQKKFINNYKSFFQENDLILSSYFSFAWTTSWIWKFSQIPRIKQKLDKKCYVWINKIQEKWIKLNKIFYYDNFSKKIIENNLENILSNNEKLIEFLNKIIYDFDKNIWFEINIFSEIPRWYSLGFSWTVWALIVSSIYSYFEKVDNKLFSKDILKNKNIFEKIRKKSFEFELISKNNNTAWESSFNTFINSPFRNFYNISDFNLKDNIENISSLDYKSTLIWYKNNFIDKNLDYILVFSWLKNDTQKIQKYIENDKKEVFEIEKFILQNNVLANNAHLKNVFNKNDSYKTINNTLAILNSHLFYYISKLNETWEEKYIFKILDNLNKNRYSLKLIEKQIDFDDKFIHIFDKIKKYSDWKIWISSLDSSKNWWMYLIASSKKDFSSVIESVKKIKKFYPDSEVLFSSEKPLDKNKNYWVKIEQFLSHWKVGKYWNSKWVFLNTKNSKTIIEYKNLEELNFDILIDWIKNKIYVWWRKLNSKNIHSQNIASEILIKLLKSENWNINNSDISFWSYRENRIELNWKVIFPFNKTILEELNYIFPLTTIWSISNYKISLKKHNLKIWFIEKIN